MVTLEVYARHRIGQDTYVGESQSTISSLISQAVDGSKIQPDSCDCTPLTTAFPAVTCNLTDSHVGRSSRKAEGVLEFKISALVPPPNTADSELQIMIYQANKVAEWLGASAPSSLEQAANKILGASDADISAFTDALENHWGPLLNKIEQFSKLVDGVAEVPNPPFSLFFL